MKEMTLVDYLIDGTQKEVADALEITSPAVNHMVRLKRDVRLTVSNKGKIVRGREIILFPSKRHGKGPRSK